MEINRPKTHVCIVNDNLIPILTPLVDKSIDVKSVIFVFVKENTENVEKLKKILKPRGIQCNEWELPRKSSFLTIKESLERLLKSFSGHELTLNITTGNRIANLAIYDVFSQIKAPIYLVDQKTDILSWLSPENQDSIQLSDILKLSHYLESFGVNISAKISASQISKELKDICYDWVKNIPMIKDAIRKLNYIAYSANNNQLISEVLDHSLLTDTGLNYMLDGLEDASLIQRNDKQIIFCNDDIRFFSNGGWLEFYVYWVILALKKDIPEIQDVSCSVEVFKNHADEKVLNELDVCFVANNKLFVIECKTKFMKTGDGNQLLYKLDSLADVLGGLHANPMVVSFFPLTKKERARASSLDIEVFDQNNLGRLPEFMKGWIKESILK